MQILLPPPLWAPREGQHLYFKFKTFGFLHTLKVHIQSNYLAITSRKNSKIIYFCSSHFSFRCKKSYSSEFLGGGRPLYRFTGNTSPLAGLKHDIIPIFGAVYIYREELHSSLFFKVTQNETMWYRHIHNIRSPGL